MGYTGPAEIRRRILATAKVDPRLKDRARDGRILDLLTTLDVFTDLVWMDGADAPTRVTLLPLDEKMPVAAIKLCEAGGTTLDDPGGWIDPAKLHAWIKRPDGRAQIWHDDYDNITPTANTCKIPNSKLRLAFADGRPTELIDLARISRIVPSRLRAALDESQK